MNTAKIHGRYTRIDTDDAGFSAILPLANRAARGPIEEAAGETAAEHREEIGTTTETAVAEAADITAMALKMTASRRTAARASEETTTAMKTETATERSDDEGHQDQEAETAETETDEIGTETAAAREATETEETAEATSTEDQADVVMMIGAHSSLPNRL